METLLRQYKNCYGNTEPHFHVFSPYCICPLGAHVDHQHGLVSSFAIDKGIDFLLSATDDGMVEMVSVQFSGFVTFNVGDKDIVRQYNWGDYLRGAVRTMQEKFTLTTGLRGIVRGSIPSGGIASSASLLCGFVTALAKVNHIMLCEDDIIEIASQAERQFIGLSSGILDQSTILYSQKNQLLYLDTETGERLLIPFCGDDDASAELPFKVVIFYSGVTRSLTNTNYNIRVEECQEAARLLQDYEKKDLGPENHILRRTNRNVFDKYASAMPPQYARRARHFFTECERVMEGTEMWRQGDVDAFGELMFESGESSILNYECGSPQLIAIYRSLRDFPGVCGARFCGAGFIGSCFALVRPDAVDDVRERVTLDYLQQFPMYRDGFRTFVCNPHGGIEFSDV